MKKNIVPKKKEKKKKKGIIDYSAESDILYTRIDNFWKLSKDKQMLTDLIRQIPGLAKLHIRGKLNQQILKEKNTDDTYKDMKVIEFQTVLKKKPLH